MNPQTRGLSQLTLHAIVNLSKLGMLEAWSRNTEPSVGRTLSQYEIEDDTFLCHLMMLVP